MGPRPRFARHSPIEGLTSSENSERLPPLGKCRCKNLHRLPSLGKCRSINLHRLMPLGKCRCENFHRLTPLGKCRAINLDLIFPVGKYTSTNSDQLLPNVFGPAEFSQRRRAPYHDSGERSKKNPLFRTFRWADAHGAIQTMPRIRAEFHRAGVKTRT